MEPLTLDFTVGCRPEHAFAVWATRTSTWWPSGHSVSGEPGIAVTFEPRPGGRIFERTSAGVEHDWGEVLVWEPPRRLAYSWHLRQDHADATRVEISFAPEGERASRLSTPAGSGWASVPDRCATATARGGAG